MFRLNLILFNLLFILSAVKSEYNATDEVAKSNPTPKIIPQKIVAPANASKLCIDDFKDLNAKYSINVTEYCKEKRCVIKCCRALDRIFYFEEGKLPICQSIAKIKNDTNKSININYSAIRVYKSDVENGIEKSLLSLSNFEFLMNRKLSKANCTGGLSIEPMINYHVLENGTLLEERPNFYNRIGSSWKMNDFCFDHVVKKDKEGVHEPILIYRVYNPPEDTQPYEDSSFVDIGKSVAMLISCFFLLLVLFVYAMIRELRNLVGMVLMAYVGTLAVTFFFKAVEVLTIYDKVDMKLICKPMSAFLYYTLLSSFFWMNMMSLDIWWTFRGMFKSRTIHRQGELAKFGWYALYSWGTPLLMTIAVVYIDYSDLSHLPNFYKPHFELCFYMKGSEGMEMRHYLYYPILTLLIMDCMFFLMTAFNIWRIRKSMAKFANDVNKYKNNQNRFGLYLKLSLVMGVSWVLEVVPNLPRWLERVATAYNSLIGVAIFFIFVFKRKILFMLCQRFSIKSKFVEDLQRRYSKYSTSSGASQDRKRSALELTSTLTSDSLLNESDSKMNKSGSMMKKSDSKMNKSGSMMNKSDSKMNKSGYE